MQFTRKDNLIIIGAGKIAYSLVPALSDKGYKIKAIISNRIKGAKELASKLKISEYGDDPEKIKIKKGVFILAVPDNQIKSAAERYSKIKIDFRHSLFIHLSGSNDISLLNCLALKKAQIASFHIMQTFPSKRRKNIKNSFAAVETNSKETAEYLFKVASDLELKPFCIESQYKTLYHLTGVFASNFINAVLFQSKQLFDLLELKQYSFNRILSPLFNSTIKNIKVTSPAKALSGPVERGDLNTVKKHIRAIKQLTNNKENILNSYLSLSLVLINATKVKYGELNRNQSEIKELLLKELCN